VLFLLFLHFGLGENSVIYKLKQFHVVVFLTAENESSDDDDTEMEVSSTDGRERTVKVKVLTFSENVAHSEDEDS